MKNWGQLAVIDLYGCDIKKFNLRDMKFFILELCKKIKMKPRGKPLVKKFGKGKLEGYSLMQFIETSSITLHSDSFDRRMFVDVFSCKKFNPDVAREFSREFFGAGSAKCRDIYR